MSSPLAPECTADYYDDGGYGGGSDNDEGYAPAADFEMPDYDPAPRVAADVEGGEHAAPASDMLSYEELCQAHITAFIAAAAAAEVQTELASRVSGWRHKMAPMLEEEDARPEFDIHQYGQLFLDRMAALTCTGGWRPCSNCSSIVSARFVCRCAHPDAAPPPTAADSGAAAPSGEGEFSFGQVVQASGTKYDVSRSFSSMLQLVNNGNVRITKLGGSNEEFTLLLQDRTMPHNNMPSRMGLSQAPEKGLAKGGAAAGGGADLGENSQQQPNVVAQPAPAAKAKAASTKAKRRKA